MSALTNRRRLPNYGKMIYKLCPARSAGVLNLGVSRKFVSSGPAWCVRACVPHLPSVFWQLFFQKAASKMNFFKFPMVDFETRFALFESFIAYLKIDLFRRTRAIVGPISYLKMVHFRWDAIASLENDRFWRDFGVHLIFENGSFSSYMRDLGAHFLFEN